MLLPAQRHTVTHFKCLPYHELPAWLAELRSRTGLGVRCLELIILCATRCSEMRQAEWTDLDWTAETLTIPAHRAKTRRPLIIPLSGPALALLTSLAETKTSRFIFPGRSLTGR